MSRVLDYWASAPWHHQDRANRRMSDHHLNWIANFIWGIADDVLRDVYVRGKYRDVILPMVVIRRLDAVLEPTKQAVLREGRVPEAWHHGAGHVLRDQAGNPPPTRQTRHNHLRRPRGRKGVGPKPAEPRGQEGNMTTTLPLYPEYKDSGVQR